MIAMITGKLGAGKTYFCVNYLVKRYYKYEEPIISYVPIEQVRIISNVDGLRLPHESLDSLVCNSAGIPQQDKMCEVFNMDFVKGSKNVIFIIDEAQHYFPRKFYHVEIFTFFQKSRHEGVDIFLITQDVASLAKELQVLCEYEIQATQRARRAQNLFHYKYILEGGERGRGEVFKSVSIKFRMDIAILYISRNKIEQEKMSFVFTRYIVVLGLCAVLAVVCFKFAMSEWFFHTPKNSAVVAKRDIGVLPESKKQSKLFTLEEWDKMQAPKISEKQSLQYLKIGDLNSKKEGSRKNEDTDTEDSNNQAAGLSDSFSESCPGCIVYDDGPAWPLENGGGMGSASNSGGSPGGSSSGSSSVAAGSKDVVVAETAMDTRIPAQGPGLAGVGRPHVGKWIWKPLSKWRSIENGSELIDFHGRTVGSVKVGG